MFVILKLEANLQKIESFMVYFNIKAFLASKGRIETPVDKNEYLFNLNSVKLVHDNLYINQSTAGAPLPPGKLGKEVHLLDTR